MNELVGQQIKYLLVQTNTENNNEQAVFYNQYNGSLTPAQDVNQATKFDNPETAEGIANLQNQLSVFLGKKFTYRVIKESISRTEMSEE